MQNALKLCRSPSSSNTGLSPSPEPRAASRAIEPRGISYAQHRTLGKQRLDGTGGKNFAQWTQRQVLR